MRISKKRQVITGESVEVKYIKKKKGLLSLKINEHYLNVFKKIIFIYSESLP